MSNLIAFAIGLFVGWNVLPQPAFIRDWWNKMTGKTNEDDS